MKSLSLWQDQESRKTLEEAIEETISAFHKTNAWQYAIWDIGYSGGKDSTALVTLLAHLLASGRLPRPKRIVVQYADTGMEVPPLQQSALHILHQLKQQGFETQVVRPALDDRFFVYMFGRGVPPPNNGRMRWCTRILKAKPMSVALEAASGGLKSLVITGVRDGESIARDERIVAACSKDSGECGQGYLHVKYENSSVADALAPIRGWRVCHVYDWLSLYAPGYGFDTSTIAEVYGYNSQNGQDEPLNARTGCMECRLVHEDHMMERVLALPKYQYLAPIRCLRMLYEELTQDHMRLQKDGTQRLKDGGMPANLYRKGPLTMEARRYGLAQVKAIQAEVNTLARAQDISSVSLISPEEENRIEELIAANTWPQGWTGTEPLASTFQEPEIQPEAIQLDWETTLAGQDIWE
ncbi:MAG: phosphoadenosine phosphosulfate reductase family protein [Ktedonobacteraceae bacterium]|nr:phosphoadenosine phosphosulfate reductase family protein [Ktedonobacteraceae bacterium]